MAEILYTGSIKVDELPSLAAACRFSSHALLLAEHMPDRVISHPEERKALLQIIRFPTDITFARYTSGRIFQEDAELRWEKQADKMHVVYLGPQEYRSVLRDYKLQESQTQKRPTLDTLKRRGEPTYHYLFGKRLKMDDLDKIGPRAQVGDFAQVRIPHFLRYPVPSDGKPYVCLKVREYIDEETGQVALFRFQGLETMEEPGE